MTSKINFFDGVTSGTVPTIGNVTASNLVQYADDATYESSEVGAPQTGNIYYNTTSNQIRYYNGSAWVDVVGEDSTDTLTNKTIDADLNTITNIDNADIKPAAAIDATKLADGSVTNTELQYINSLTSNAQDQIDTAQGTADANTFDIADIRTTTGTSDGDTDMGAYTGAILTDNQSTKTNIQELSDAIEGLTSGLAFQGNWNANTNTPTLTSSTGTAGYYYNVSVAGTTNLDGQADWGVGDWAVFTDTGIWQKIDNSENVTSVNSQTGSVVLDTDDISEGSTNLYYTDTRADARIAAASIDDLSDVDTTTTPPGNGQGLVWDGANWVPGNSGGAGLTNFFSQNNSDLEQGLEDWITFNDSSAIPVDGIGGTASEVSTSILESSAGGTLSQLATPVIGQQMTVTNRFVGQSFNSGLLSGPINSVTFSIFTFAGTTGNIVAEVRARSGSLPTGPVLATSNPVDVTSYTPVFPYGTPVTLTFPSPYVVSASEGFCITINGSAVSFAASGLTFGASNTDLEPTGSVVVSSDSGTSWTTQTGDLYFSVDIGGATEALEGDKSLLVSKASGISAQGQGVSVNSEEIDLLYRNNIAYGSFGYDTTSANYSGTWGIWLYDVNNSSLINILESDNLIPAGKIGTFNYSFIVPDECQQLRFIAMETDTNTLAYDIILDLLKSGPDTLTVTIPYTRSETIDVTGSGSYTGGTIQVERTNNQVTISNLSLLTHASSSNVSSATGLIPEWARPTLVAFNSSYADGSIFSSASVSPSGVLNTVYGAATTNSGSVTLSYTVPDDGLTIQGAVNNSQLLFEEATLTADVTTNTTMSDLTISNLVPGRRYNINAQFYFSTGATGNTYFIQALHDSNTVAYTGGTFQNNEFNYKRIQESFVATTNTLTFVTQSISGTSAVLGNGTKDESFVQVVEEPFSQTAIIVGTVKLGTETWTDSQTNATTQVTLYRSGPLLKVTGVTSFTGAAAGATSITIPSSYTISSTIPSAIATKMGDSTLLDFGTATYEGSVNYLNPNAISLKVTDTAAAYAFSRDTSATIPFTWANGDKIVWAAEWPVEGW